MIKLFCILCHRFSKSLNFTIDYLASDKKNIILIHIDKSVSDISQFLSVARENVIIIDNRVSIKWGHFSMIEATLNLMRKSFNYDYDYLFLLSGDDFPAMSLSCMDAILSKNYGCDFIHFQDKRNNYVDPLKRFGFIYSNIEFKKEKSLPEKFFLKFYRRFFMKRNNVGYSYLSEINLTLYKGTQWFTLKKSSVFFINDFINSHPKIIDSFSRSFCSDEMFFHSIIMKKIGNLFYSDKNAVNDCLRYIDWNSGPEYPKLLKKDDLIKLKNLNCFFARKASDSLSSEDFNYIVNGFK